MIVSLAVFGLILYLDNSTSYKHSIYNLVGFIQFASVMFAAAMINWYYRKKT